MASVVGLIASIATLAKVVKEGLSVAKQLYNAPEELHSLLVSQGIEPERVREIVSQPRGRGTGKLIDRFCSEIIQHLFNNLHGSSRTLSLI